MGIDLKYSDKQLTFIVDTLCSIGMEHKGGSIAIHKLVYELANLGYFVYVFNEPFFPHENIHVIKTEKHEIVEGWFSNYLWDGFGFNPDRTITIYSNVTWHNPFNTLHNVRWILHDYDEKIWETYGENDLICNFGTFKVPKNTEQMKLTVFNYNLDKFYNLNLSNRKGFGHIIHKFTPDWGLDFLKNFGSTEIPHHNGKKSVEYLLNEFNKYEYVLTFDYKSYYTTAAALCGTKAIILNPDKNITPSEYRIDNPIQMCGVSYGFDDIKWSESTIHLTRNHVTELEISDKRTIHNFLRYWENKLL